MKSQGMALAAVFLVTSTFPVLAQEAVLTVQKSDKHGDYIADANGRALYMFEADTQGKGPQLLATRHWRPAALCYSL